MKKKHLARERERERENKKEKIEVQIKDNIGKHKTHNENPYKEKSSNLGPKPITRSMKQVMQSSSILMYGIK
jgi:hypothetical protein